jgi:hypothetical protein
MLLLLMAATLCVASTAQVTAGTSAGGLRTCGSIKAKGVWHQVILEQEIRFRNGACLNARRLAVHCLRYRSATPEWTCRWHPYPNRRVAAVLERHNPWKLVTVYAGPIAE